MKFSRNLTINNRSYPLIHSDVRLSYSSPGRASFHVEADKPLHGVVLLTLSNSSYQAGHTQFYGYIERSTRVSDSTQLIFCREKSAVLKNRLPLALRNKTLRDLLTEVATKTGLRFSLPQQSYADQAVPFFINTGPGYQLFDQIAVVFQIPDYLWQLKRDGSIFVGSWQDGHWPDRAITLPDNLFTKHQASQSAELLAIPGLRPGYVLNGQRLTEVNLKDNKMVVSWTQP